MQTSVTFRHMDATEALKLHAIERTTRMAKYFEGADAHVVLSSERYLHKAEININAHGVVICANEVSSDMYNSIDRSMDKVEKQVRRYKDKLTRLRPKEGAKLKMHFKLLEANGDADLDTSSDLPPTIIESKEFQARPMMIEEAVMHMDLLHNDILVFLNPKTDHVSILYRKQGNKYGLIETSSAVSH